MGYVNVKAAKLKPPEPLGVRASCSGGDVSSDRVVTITMNKAAQTRFFGRFVNPETDRFHVWRGDSTDKGTVQIRLSADGEIEARKSMHGSIRFRLQAFPPVPQAEEKAADCKLISSDGEASEFVIRLPWNDGSRR